MIDKILNQGYKYYILYLNSPVVINKYDKVFVADLVGIVQLYSGDKYFPTCSLLLCDDEINAISVAAKTNNMDEIRIERREGEELTLYGFRTA